MGVLLYIPAELIEAEWSDRVDMLRLNVWKLFKDMSHMGPLIHNSVIEDLEFLAGLTDADLLSLKFWGFRTEPS